MACAAEFQRLREGYITQTSTQSFVQKRVTLCVWLRAWDTPTIETQRLALKNALRPSQRLIHASGLRAPGSGSTGQQVPLYTLCLSLYSKVSLKNGAQPQGPRTRGVRLLRLTLTVIDSYERDCLFLTIKRSVLTPVSDISRLPYLLHQGEVLRLWEPQKWILRPILGLGKDTCVFAVYHPLLAGYHPWGINQRTYVGRGDI